MAKTASKDVLAKFNQLATRDEQWAELAAEINQLSNRAAHYEQLLGTINTFSNKAAVIENIEEILKMSVNLVKEDFDFTQVSIFMLDKSNQWIEQKASTTTQTPKPVRLKLDDTTPVSWVIENKTARLFNPGEFDQQDNFELVYPLVSRGQVLGAFCIQHPELTQNNLAHLRPLIDHIANTIQNAILFNYADHQLEQLVTLHNINLQAGNQLEQDKLLDIIARLCVKLVKADASVIRLIDNNHQLKIVAAYNPPKNVKIGQITELNDNLHSQVINTQECLLINDWPSHPQAKANDTVQAVLIVPIIMPQKTFGIIEVYSHSLPQAFDNNDLYSLSLMASQTATAIKNTRLSSQAENSRRFLQAIIEHIPDPIFIKDKNHILTEMNYANADVIGRPKTELLGKTDSDFFPPELANEFYRRDDEVLQSKEIFEFEDTTLWADNREHTAYTQLIPLTGVSGEAEYILGISHDITERKLYEAERERFLQETESLYHGSKEITNALSEHQVFEALFTQIRLQDPCEIAAYRLHLVDDEPIWAEIIESWQKRNNPTFPIKTRFTLAGMSGVKLLTTTNPLFIEDVGTDPRLSPEERESLAPTAACSLAVLPLIFSGYELGPVIVYFNVPYKFSEMTKRFWLAMADQASTALGNRQLVQAAAYRAIQMETAAEVIRSASSLLELDELLTSVVALIRDRFELYYVGVYLVSDDKKWAYLRAGTGTVGKTRLAANHQVKTDDNNQVGWSITHRQPRIALDVGKNAITFNDPQLPNIRSEMTLPLIYHNTSIGALTLQSDEQAAFSREDTIFLQTMADQLANAIENARLYAKAQQEIKERKQVEEEILRRNKELADLNRVTTSIASMLELESILAAVSKEMARIFNARNCGIALLNPEQTELSVVADHSTDKNEPSAVGLVIPLENNPASIQVIETGEAVVVTEVQTNPLTESIHDILKERNTQTLAILPLRVRGEVIGTIGLDTTNPNRVFTSDEIKLAETIAGQLAGVIENARLFEQTQAALTQREQTQQTLAQREQYLATQLQIQNFLLATKGPDTPYSTVLELLGEVSNADRVYVFENHFDAQNKLFSSQRAEWCTPGVPSQADNETTQNLQLEESLTRWYKTLVKGRSINGRVEDFPETEQAFIKPHGVRAILILPLVVSGDFFGFIGFDNCDNDKPWDASEEGLLSTAAAAVSLWHERRRAEESLLMALQRTESLYRIGDALATATNQQTTFETVLAEYLRLLNLKPAYGSIILYEHNKGYSKVHALCQNSKPVETTLSYPAEQDRVAKHLMQHKIPLVVEDVHTHTLTTDNAKLWQHHKNVKQLLFIPVLVKGDVIGALSVGVTTTAYRFSQSDIEIGQVITDQMAIWLENRQLLTETQYRSERLQTAAEISRAASSILDVDELMNSSVNLIRNRFNFYYVGLFLLDDVREWAILRAGTGEAGRIQLSRNHRLRVGGESMIGWSVANRKARIALDVGEEAVRFQNPILPDTHSEMALPLISRDEVIGALTVQSTDRGAFSDEDITMLQTMADQLANALANARLFETVAQAQQEAEGRLQETLALQTLSQNLAATLQVNEILNILFEACTQEIGFEYVMFSLVDKTQNIVRAIGGVGVTESNLKRANRSLDSKGIMADIVRTGRTEIITGWDDRFDSDTFEAEGHIDWIRVFTPITLRRENIGVIEAGFNKSVQSNITNTQLRLLKAFVSQTALAIDNAQRYEVSQRAARREALIKEITTKVRASTDLDTILQTTVTEIGNAITSKRAFIHLTPQQDSGDGNGTVRQVRKRGVGNG